MPSDGSLRFGIAAAWLALVALTGCSGGSPGPSGADCPSGTWTALGTADFGQPTLSVMFRDASFGIATDLDGGIHYTQDGGRTWTYAAASGLSRVALEMDGDRIWHVGYGGSVTRSLDAGRTWEVMSSLPHAGHIEYMSFADQATGWAVTTELEAYFVTRDSARTWERVPFPDGMGRPAALHLLTPEIVYLLDTAGDLFVTRDGGGTWEMLQLPLAEGASIPVLNHSAALRFTDPQHGFAALNLLADGSGRTLGLRTADGGRTWVEEPLPVPMGMFHLSRDAVYLTHVDLVEQGRITRLCSRPSSP
jgi:photosystem II stability/assembly factor-like uncharacterized protein